MNEQNLKRLTHAEAVKEGSKGGKASGEVRRKKKEIREKMKTLLSFYPTADKKEQLEALGIVPEDADNEMLLCVSLFQTAISGDTGAFDRVMQILGKDIKHEELKFRRDEFNLKKKQMQDNDSNALNKLDEVLAKINSNI